jgi:hypothetical protein
MTLINEDMRKKIKEEPYTTQGITSINSAKYLQNKCSWICHNNTSYCKKYHVKHLKPLYSITDVFYYGAIGILKSTGNYGAANIIFLVFLFPFTIMYLIIKSLNIQDEIQKIKKRTYE